MKTPPAVLVPPVKTKADMIRAAEIAAQVDELGTLEAKLAPFTPDLKRVEVLRAAIRAQFAGSAAAEPFTASGDKFTCILGSRAMTKIIDLAKLFRALGPKRFISVASVTLAALDRAEVTLRERADCIREEQTGIRSLKIYPRA